MNKKRSDRRVFGRNIMNKIISFTHKKDERKKYVFRNRAVKIKAENILFPCICLYDQETEFLVACPGYERWYLQLSRTTAQRSPTLQKKSYHICSFLNFILWHTDCDAINEITMDNIRGFLVDFRETADGNQRDPSSWQRGITDVYGFLETYQKYNPQLQYAYSAKDLITTTVVRTMGAGRKAVIKETNKFFVKAPKKTKKKNRYLLPGYLELLIFNARKYDPMIALGIACQAYGGLREGEIVNLTRNSLQMIDMGFGRIGAIKIDLMDEAAFAKSFKGKCEFGYIKKYRVQQIYPDFIQQIIDLYNEHDSILALKGASDALTAPLFVNHQGNPMTVDSYCGRVEQLFREKFVPALKRICMTDGEWAENAPFIEAWEDKIDPHSGKRVRGEFPGCHMFRHWFTMYLLENTNLTHDEIAHVWRGDSSSEAMDEYIHVNSQMISLYKNSVFTFQRSILEEIL